MSDLSVAVVMTAWDADRFIADAITSVTAQTRPPTELVVIDDGSTDGTADTAERLGATVLRCPHRGIGPSRNAGIAACDSDLIAFLDADDLWLPAKLERQVEVLAGDATVDAALCLTDEFLDRPAGADLAVREPRLGVASPIPSSTVVRRDLVARVGGFAEVPVGDWVHWWARVRRSGALEHVVPEVLVRRRIHDANNSARRHDGGAQFLAIVRQHRRERQGGS